jgi:ssDNA-binding Zn-finger/Zn-ribbon topoisomerase 1
MILASRDDLISEENRERPTAKSEVRKAGYGFIEGRRVDETSLLVVGKSGKFRFFYEAKPCPSCEAY